MINGKESEEATTKDKCKSLGLYPKSQWLNKKGRKKWHQQDLRHT